MVNIIDFREGGRWLVDVGFGGDTPTEPIPLKDDEVGHRNFGNQRARLKFHDGSRTSEREARLWLYQTQDEPDPTWKTQYCFAEIEFTYHDYIIMSYYTSTSPNSYLTTSVIVSKLEMENGQIVRKIILHDAGLRAQENKAEDGKTKPRAVNSEKERLEVMEKEFGIHLTEEEKQGICGKPTELTGSLD